VVSRAQGALLGATSVDQKSPPIYACTRNCRGSPFNLVKFQVVQELWHHLDTEKDNTEWSCLCGQDGFLLLGVQTFSWLHTDSQECQLLQESFLPIRKEAHRDAGTEAPVYARVK